MSRHYKFDLSPDGTMKALILYDSFILAAKANAMLQRAGHHADVPVEWNIRPWRLDTLKTSDNANEVLSDAADAHLILFALGQNSPQPFWLKSWLEQWAAQRLIQDAGLAMFSDGNTRSPDSPAVQEIARFADRHGLSCLVDDDGHVDAGAAYLSRALQKREPTLSPAFLDFADVPIHAPPLRWGINE